MQLKRSSSPLSSSSSSSIITIIIISTTITITTIIIMIIILTAHSSECLKWATGRICSTAAATSICVCVRITTSMKVPGARCILMTNMMGIQMTEQMTMSQPRTMDQVG